MMAARNLADHEIPRNVKFLTVVPNDGLYSMKPPFGCLAEILVYGRLLSAAVFSHWNGAASSAMIPYYLPY